MVKSKIISIICLIFFSACSNKPSNNILKDKEVLFHLIPAEESGLTIKNEIIETASKNGLNYEYFYNGGGVAIGDINGDGLDDIAITANQLDNKLYLNKGNLKFQDITKASNFTDYGEWTTGITMADINADGLLDIYVSRSGKLSEDKRRNKLFINQGNNKDNIPVFKEMSKVYGLDDIGGTTQALFFDFDLDNDLDLFLINHNFARIPFYTQSVRTQRDAFAGDKLYENTKNGFVDISVKANIHGNVLGFGLGLAAGDINNDSWPDIYVANDYSEHDYLYINNKDGTFSEVSKSKLSQVPFFSMGCDIADFNNDGYEDIFSLDMAGDNNYNSKASMSGMNTNAFWQAVSQGYHYQYMYNAVQMNNGGGKLSEVAQLAGLSNTDWSWGILLEDLDNDGLKDAYISNGIRKDFRNNDFQVYRDKIIKSGVERSDSIVMDVLRKIPQRPGIDHVYRNNGDLTFKKINEEWGILEKTFSNGFSMSDLDNDGDLDIVVSILNGTPLLYKNMASQTNNNNSLEIQFEGPKGNPFGIGASVTLENEDIIQFKHLYLTRGFQSSVSPKMHYGLGKDSIINKLTVKWPDGKNEILTNVKSGTLLLSYKNAKKIIKTAQKKTNLISNITKQIHLNFRHKENTFNDFTRESLLPHKMSQFGPAIAIADVNNDNLEDVFIGGAIGQKGKLFLQNQDGTLSVTLQEDISSDNRFEDVDAHFFDCDNDNDLDLYVVSGGNESFQNSLFYEDRLYINEGLGNFTKSTTALPKLFISGACVKSEDFDKDGDLDLFVAGRQVPGNYPLPTDSYILRNDTHEDDIKFTNVTNQLLPTLNGLGMVTDALWTDLNEDGFKDLVICGEWMSLRVFINNEGKSFSDRTEAWGLGGDKGWWFSLAKGDFDKDGDIDIIAGNLGENYKYQASKEAPFEIYASDFDTSGDLDIVLAFHEDNKIFPLRGRECSSNEMPFIKKKFPTYKDFANADLEKVYSKEKLQASTMYKATTFQSVYYENKNGKLIAHALPKLAQIAPVNAITVDDFNKDNNLDVLLAGNMHNSEVETPRNDASNGLLLLGNGMGEFEVLDSHKTGTIVTGEVRKIKPLTLADGTKSLIFGRNNDSIKVVKIHSK